MALRLLEVVYEGWGEQWPLGRLADDGRHLLFEYSGQALRQGLELSPSLPLQTQAFQGFAAHQFRLPGLIADALPDGWGLLLMDRLCRRHGRDPQTLSPLDRLAFIGDRAVGALSFRPDASLDHGDEDLGLLELATQAQEVVHDRDTEALTTLARLGGSPQGARPKVLVHFDPGRGIVSTRPADGCEPWLVKFQAGNEHPEVCAIEMLYAELARECGIDMPATHLFELDARLSAFGIKRFDRDSGMRVPVLTLAGAADLDFRVPDIDYAGFLRVTRRITGSQAEVDKAFQRAVFNVVFHNRDDHSKNFSYRLDRDRHWRLSPGYDLTFSVGPGGEHHTDVYGEGKAIGRAHLLRLAREEGVRAKTAQSLIDRALEVAARFTAMADGYPIRKATRSELAGLVAANVARLS